MKIALGADHRGFQLKDSLIVSLARRGIETEDFGTHGDESVDYPDYARKVALKVAQGAVDQGILICSTGAGMTVAANRMPRIRAALCLTPDMAKQARGHLDANILVLGADFTPPEEAERILDEWLKAKFEGSVRHKRRLQKASSLGASIAEPMALYERDPEICASIQAEATRQERTLDMIASETFVSRAIREAQGSVLTHKYAEGYPGKRWYQGCKHMDEVEQLAIDRAKQLFGAEHANVQPHCGSSANMAVYFAALEPGDTLLAMKLAHGGHLTHGHEASFSGRLFNVVSYGVSKNTELLDYDEIAALAREHKPRMVVCGSSAYSRIIDFKRLRKIADSVGAYLMADIAHIAGLVVADCHPDPVPFCEFVTATTHKTLCGPRGGIILCQKRFAGDIDRQVFPGIQGGPLMHVVAAKAVCFHEAMRPAFQKYQEQIVRNARALAEELSNGGLRIVSGGTDNHLMLVDLASAKVTGRDAALALEQAGIVANKNSIPFDKAGTSITSGIRLGTPAITARGMKEPEMKVLGGLIVGVVKRHGNKAVITKARAAVDELVERFPVRD